MVCLTTMPGLGKPGINKGNLKLSVPLDFNFYFLGYADGGMSGDLQNTSMPVELYQRMLQPPSMSSSFQRIPCIFIPGALADGKAEGWPWIAPERTCRRGGRERQLRRISFDRLPEESGEYRLEVAAPGLARTAVEAKPGASVNLGEIRLKRQT